jgi:STAS-like domain of unknown function (DUF4325)
LGQGNGLYGSWRIAQLSGGIFEIFSGRAHLFSSPDHGLSIQDTAIPFAGTLVVSKIPYLRTIDLSEALIFGGKKIMPVDLVELEYEVDTQGNVDFFLGRESGGGFGSRQAGEPVRNKLLNIARLDGINRITIDFSDIPLLSSSYADEVFGKMFLELYRVPEIVTRGRFPDGGESDSTWRTQEARHVGSDTIAPGF